MTEMMATVPWHLRRHYKAAISTGVNMTGLVFPEFGLSQYVGQAQELPSYLC